jgi:hypothetical protein
MVAQGGNFKAIVPGGLEHRPGRIGPDENPIDIYTHFFNGGCFYLIRKFYIGHEAYSLITASNWQDS